MLKPVGFWPQICLNLYPSIEDLTTHITILHSAAHGPPGRLAGAAGWGIQLRITINFHNSWLSHVTRWNFDEKCNFFFTLQLRNLLFFYFALDFVFYSCPEQRFTTLHSNWDLLVQLGFNQSHHDDVVRHGGKSENPAEASCDLLPLWLKLG